MSSVRMIWFVALGLAGCVQGFRLTPGPVKFYDGPDQPDTAVALIENDRNMFLESIDGRTLRRWTHVREVVQFQVLPGTHAVVAGPSERAGFVSLQAVRVEFTVEAGHRYVISRSITGGSAGPAWELLLTDVTSGARFVPGESGRGEWIRG